MKHSCNKKFFGHKILIVGSKLSGNQAAKDTSQGIGQTQNAADELAQMAADLQALVGQFKY